MSLLGTQVYANPDTPCWLSVDGGTIEGNLIVNGDIDATGTITGDAGVTTVEGGTGFQVVTAGGAPVSAIQHLPAPTSRTIINTNDPLLFAQVGTTQGNTSLTLSAFGANTDVLAVGGSVTAANIMQVLDTTPGFVVQGGGGATSRFRHQQGITPATVIESFDPIYFNQVGNNVGNTYLELSAPSSGGDRLFVGGTVETLNLRLNSTGGGAVIGSGTLAAGIATINTTASDVTCYIMLTRTNLNASTAVGELRIVNKIANSFTVNSVDALGAIVVGDDSDFDWVLFNQA